MQLHTQGYERPVLSWHVAGQTVVSRHQLGDRAVTRMTALPGYEPSDLGIVVAEVCWDQLTLDVTLWHGSPGPITVRVDVTESAGLGSAAVTSRRAVDELLGATARVTSTMCAGPDDEPGLDPIRGGLALRGHAPGRLRDQLEAARAAVDVPVEPRLLVRGDLPLEEAEHVLLIQALAVSRHAGPYHGGRAPHNRGAASPIGGPSARALAGRPVTLWRRDRGGMLGEPRNS